MLLLEIIFLKNYNLEAEYTPLSDKNRFFQKTQDYLYLSKINPLNISHLDYQNEIQFYLNNPSGQSYPVIFSTNRDPLTQVTALQKIIKIANIKEQEINFIDLSAQRPYATF